MRVGIGPKHLKADGDPRIQKEEAIARQQPPIIVTPVWQPNFDRALFVRICVALVDQLVAEAESATNGHQASRSLAAEVAGD